MAESPVIECRGVGKIFHVHRSAWRRLRAAMAAQTLEGDVQLRALDDVTFDLPPGGSLGIVGPNGSGKSTLMKILAGILTPSAGTVAVRGRVASIIELGAGFHPEFTGRQNFHMNGAILGFSREQLEALYERAVAFSGLANFMEMPIKTYSSGMISRLAFAIAIHTEPDILLVDEALAVGDAIFSHRCLGRIHALCNAGTALVLVTHDVNAVRQMCDRTILLDQGCVVSQGEPEEVLLRYQTMVAERLSQVGEGGEPFHRIGAVDVAQGGDLRYGTFEAVIEGFTVTDASGERTLRHRSRERMTVEMAVRFHRDVDEPVYGIMLRNRFGIEVFGVNSLLRGDKFGPARAGDLLTVRISLDLILTPGTYTVSLAVHTPAGHFCDYQVEATTVEVLGPAAAIGVADLPHTVEVSPREGGEDLAHPTPAPHEHA